MRLALTVNYTEAYPDTAPELSLEAEEGEFDEDEGKQLLDALRTVVRS